MKAREQSKLEKVLDIIQHEPNYETFDYKGYHCVIKRMMYPSGGQLNGYVRLPKGHKFYGKGYDDIPVECHGGLTFAGELEDGDSDYYIGFDTAHFQDYMPFMQFALPATLRFDDPCAHYKDIAYVRNECKKIVDQL